MRIFLTSLLIAFVHSAAALAQSGPIVVELYTSQGCSSCPPADKLLGELANRDDVIPLALHVDYWDYLGWKDNFGDPKYTSRQRSYARAANKRTIYTPQMIIQGSSHVVGNRPAEVRSLLTAHGHADSVVNLRASREGTTLRVSLRGVHTAVGPNVVQLVRYLPEQVVSIARGENAGRRITYSNVVVSWTVIGEWNGRGTFDREIAIKGSEPAVVIVQKPNTGAILAAQRVE